MTASSRHGPQMARLASVVCFWLFSSVAASETFCALTLRIETSDGKPARRTWVQLIDPRGKVEKQELVEGDTFRACDFGAGPYSVRVGSNECHPVTVSNLRFRMGYPISFRVQKAQCEMATEHSGCELTLRVSDHNGRRLPAVEAYAEGKLCPERTDELGRVAALLAAGERAISVVASGYEPSSFRFSCEEGANVTREVTLMSAATARKPK
jgi:hypothetical protein